MALQIVNLEKRHNRSAFTCKHSSLEDYIKKNASQDVKRNLSACFVLEDGDTVLGYYTLSSNGDTREDFPEEMLKGLPTAYRTLPTVLLGRLAITDSQQGKGYGEVLLLHALNRILLTSQTIGVVAVVVDPIDKSAEDFYLKYGFIKTDGKRMYMPKGVISGLLNN